jgi:hypothetical protein
MPSRVEKVDATATKSRSSCPKAALAGDEGCAACSARRYRSTTEASAAISAGVGAPEVAGGALSMMVTRNPMCGFYRVEANAPQTRGQPG